MEHPEGLSVNTSSSPYLVGETWLSKHVSEENLTISQYNIKALGSGHMLLQCIVSAPLGLHIVKRRITESILNQRQPFSTDSFII